MTDATQTTDTIAYKRSADAISTLVDETQGVLEGLQALRSLDSPVDHAIQAVLDVREINRIRLGWELFEVLTEGRGLDSEEMLLEALGVDNFMLARDALWGEPA